MEKEYITHESQDKDAWICLCGNNPCMDGFFSCDEEGNEVEPDAGWTTGWYVCNRCGRMIDHATLEVVGRNKLLAETFLTEAKRK